MGFTPVATVTRVPTSIGTVWIDAQLDAAGSYLLFCSAQVLDQTGAELVKPRLPLSSVVNPGLCQTICQALDSVRTAAENDLL